MHIDTNMITIIGFAITVIGMGVKYGLDQGKIKSDIALQNVQIEALKKMHEEEKAHNAEQHKEFYTVTRDTIELKVEMRNIIAGLDEIKKILSELRK